MMVIQHEPREGPGSLSALLPPSTRIVRAWEEPIPTEPEPLLVLGGGMSANDDLPFLREEERLLRRCLSSGVPVLGLCLGSQLLAKALGGTVAKAPEPELGFYRVRVLPEASTDPLFSAAPSSFVALHWHFDAFTLPPGAVPLADSTLTSLQAFRYGSSAWGVQFHLEMSDELLRAFIDSSPADLSATGVEAEALLAGAKRELPQIGNFAAAVFQRWLALG
jgi:GMP synthase (glutamine-hydrolysing)